MYLKKSDNVFIAGHEGMLGKALLKNFKSHEYRNIFTSSKNKLDLFNFEEIKSYLIKNKIEVVILSGAKVGGILANFKYPPEYLLDNLKIQTNVIEAAWKCGVKRLLFIGCSCIYPKFAKQPIKEEELLSGDLESTLIPYAIAKISGIKLCIALRSQYGFDAISLMPSNMYGIGDNFNNNNSHVLSSFIRRFHEAKINAQNEVICWGSGNVYREFLFAEDCADACRFCLENWNPDFNNISNFKNGEKLTYLNVGNGIDITIKELSKLVAKIVGFKGVIKWDQSLPDGTPRKLLDVSRIKKLGWSAKTDLKDGIEQTYKQFLIDLKNQNARL